MYNLNTLKAVKRRIESITHKEYNYDDDIFEEVPANLDCWISDDKMLYVSAETKNAVFFIDYYGEIRPTQSMFISSKLKDIANEFGGYWEWESSALISFCK